MKKLEDFNAEKVELKTINGGRIQATDTMTIIYSGTEVCEVKGDGPDEM
jgi:hypothetical protein